MTPTETVLLTRYVKALCPAQAFDEYTPDVWHDVLHDIALDDARAAVAVLGQRERWIAPKDIRDQVARVRRDRLERHIEDVPDADPDNPIAYLAALRAGRTRTANTELAPRPVQALIAQAARQLPAIPRRARKDPT